MDWQISIGVKGWFDQSSMREPILEDVRWEIDESNKQRVLGSTILTGEETVDAK